ncbi:MAG: hypothetical protein WCA37_05390, partial [Terracidiphilus sp.]
MTGALGLLVLPLTLTSAARPDPADSVPPATLTATQIVAEIARHNSARTKALKNYQSLRHYEVRYRGFAANLDAKMDVAVDYDAATGKSFRIVSQSGSRLLCDKVLKRAVDSEEEAQKNPASTALTPANYHFTLEGRDTLGGRPAYILDVDPIA